MVKPDNFKFINDTFGHEAGDQTLRILGAAYSEMIGENDALVRFMGNEFGFVLINTGREDALRFAEQLQRMITNLDISEVIRDADFSITLSIGITVYPDYGASAQEIIQKAHELPLIGRARGGGKILFPEDKKETAET